MDMVERPSGLVVPKPVGLVAPGNLRCAGVYHGRIVRDGEVVDEFDADNLIVNQGLDHILGVEFCGAQQVTAWYLALYSNNYVPVGSDTAGTIVANAGEVTGYTANTRIPWNAAEANQAATNSANLATFTFNATLTIYGAFLTSSGQQQSTQGTLFSAAQFSSPKNVGSGDQLLLTYTFNAASA